jgi:hypothetical protein
MGKVSLVKREIVDLTKDAGRALRALGLGGLQMNVELVFDKSGSMEDEYLSGLAQSAVDRIFALAKTVDPDGKLGVTVFHHDAYPAPDMVDANAATYVNKELARFEYGATNYAPALKLLQKKYSCSSFFGKKPAALPTLVVFITDGANGDASETISAMQLLAKTSPLLVKFIGLDTTGNTRFPMLEKLDDMVGREFDNADFFPWNSQVTDEELYKKIFNEIPTAIQAMKAAGLLA